MHVLPEAIPEADQTSEKTPQGRTVSWGCHEIEGWLRWANFSVWEDSSYRRLPPQLQRAGGWRGQVDCGAKAQQSNTTGKIFAVSPLPRFFQKRRALAALPCLPAQSHHRRPKMEESSGWGKASLADVFRLQSRRRCPPIQKCYLINEKRHHLMRCSPGPINYKLWGSHSRKSWH